MAASYPAAIKSFSARTDGVDDVVAADINAAYDEIEAIETELGTDPAGDYTNVVMRLDAQELAIYETNAGQSIPTGATTIVNFEDVSSDPSSLVTIGAAWKFTAAKDGYYVVSAMVTFAASADWDAANRILLSVWVDGVEVRKLSAATIEAAAVNQVYSANGSTLVDVAATSYIDVRVYQDSGSSLALLTSNTYNHVSIYRVANS